MAVFDEGQSIDLRVLDHADPDGCCVRFIDPYGDTIFNLLQVPTLVSELLAMKEMEPDPAFGSSVDRVIRFLQTAGDEVHTFFRFVGD